MIKPPLASPLLAGLIALLIVASSATNPAAGQGAPATREKIDVSRLGPQVGQRVPDFSLNDQAGRTRNLQSIMGSRGAMLVFFRSADW
jgi:hypothetical protein